MNGLDGLHCAVHVIRRGVTCVLSLRCHYRRRPFVLTCRHPGRRLLLASPAQILRFDRSWMAEQKKPVIANAYTTRNAATCKLVKECSVNLWSRVNAGYVTPKREPISLTHETYQYKRELLDKKSYEHHRKRDSFTEYAEAAARLKNIFGNTGKKPPIKKKDGKGGKSGEGKAPAGNGSPASGASEAPAAAAEPAK